VNVGFAAPEVGITEEPFPYRFSIPCTRQSLSTTPELGVSDIRVVPGMMIEISRFLREIIYGVQVIIDIDGSQAELEKVGCQRLDETHHCPVFQLANVPLHFDHWYT
jgi:hypothetical protein